MVVKQVSDGYAGEVIGERYQVMSSCIGATFYIADLVAEDILVRVDGRGSDTKKFTSIAEAEAFIRLTLLGEKFIGGDHATSAEVMQEIDMARNGKVVAVAADTRLDEKPSAKTKRVSSPSAPPPTPKSRPGRGLSMSGTVAATCRALIKEGKMNDDQMLAAIRASFPDKKIASNAISYYREH